jgi:hypothetical protein
METLQYFTGGFLLFWFDTHGLLLVGRLFFCFTKMRRNGAGGS